jgi:hypothetical protein
MLVRLVAALLAGWLGPALALAQPASTPVPLYPTPHAIVPEPLPPPPAEDTARPASPNFPPSPPPPAMSAPNERVFCEQPVAVQLADPNGVAEPYRPFIGIWSDASWTPLLCAALIVENVAPDGTARILYAFGPMGANPRATSGVLHGTGIIRDGELRFQNSDGSQFAFRPAYADLDGRLTTPQGQSYAAIFKKTP